MRGKRERERRLSTSYAGLAAASNLADHAILGIKALSLPSLQKKKVFSQNTSTSIARFVDHGFKWAKFSLIQETDYSVVPGILGETPLFSDGNQTSAAE